MPRLRPPANLVERRAMAWWATQSTLAFGPLVAGLAALAAVIRPAAPWLLVSLGVVVIAWLVHALVVSRIRYRVHRWEVTDSAVYARSGWFYQESQVAPMSRIQTVDTLRGPLEQRFRLTTLTVTTASAKGSIEIAGLDHEHAQRLVEQLTELTQATAEDAT